jgi:hypothetical protein
MKYLDLVVRQRRVTATGTDEFGLCTPDNITIIPNYRTGDSLCYLVSRCNYCGKRWAEFWVTYRYILSPLREQHQYQD